MIYSNGGNFWGARGSYLHQEDADGNPDDFTDAANDAHEDAEGSGKAESGNGDDEATLLHAQLHGEEAQQIGQKRGEREDEDGMEEGEHDATKASTTVNAEEEEHEQDFEGLDDAGQVFEGQTAVEGPFVLLIKGGNLLVDVPQLLGMGGLETGGPALQAWHLGQPAEDSHSHAALIAFGQDPEGHQTEDDNGGKGHPYGGGERQVADGCKGQIEENGGEPQQEVGQEMHHGIKDDGRGGALGANVLRQFQYAVGLAAQSAHWCGVVEGIAGDGQPVDAPEEPAAVRRFCPAIASDDAEPRPGIDGIDDYPDADDGHQPIAGVGDVLPEFDKADVEGEEHDHHRHHADDEKQIVKPLLGPLHF